MSEVGGPRGAATDAEERGELVVHVLSVGAERHHDRAIDVAFHRDLVMVAAFHPELVASEKRRKGSFWRKPQTG